MEKLINRQATSLIVKHRKIHTFINTIEIYGKEFYDLSFPFNRDLIEEIKESTEKRQWINKTKTWRLEKSPRNDFVLSFLKGENPYKIYDEKSYDYCIDHINDKSHKHSEFLKVIDKFWSHQRSMYNHEITHMRCITAGQTRTGKTLPTFTAIAHENVDKAWWIAPKSALRGLKLELIKWNFPLEIILLTYDAFRNKIGSWGDNKLLNFVPKFIVFDEAHKLKNSRSIQGKLARHVSEFQLKANGNDNSYMVLLSGTPSPLKPSDWWNLSEVCCPGFLREGSSGMMDKRLGEFEQRDGVGGQQYWHLIKWKKEEVENLSQRLEGMVETFLRKDCLDLPEPINELIRLPMTKEYIKASKLLRKIEGSGVQLTMKLRLLSDGIIYKNENDIVKAKNIRVDTIELPNCPKDKQLISDLKEFEDVGRVIIYCAFQGTIDKISKICIQQGWAVLKADGRGWETLYTIYSINECLYEMDGSNSKNKSLNPSNHEEYKIPKLVFLANQGSASTGLELSASPVIINYSQAYNAADQEQANGRALSNNMDKEKGLIIKNYIHIPVDELVYNNVMNKNSIQKITMGDIDAAMSHVWS